MDCENSFVRSWMEIKHNLDGCGVYHVLFSWTRMKTFEVTFFFPVIYRICTNN